MSLLIIAALAALGVSFFCSLMEATLLSLSPGQIADISRGRPGIGKTWLKFKDDIERPIAVILIVNTAAHTIGAAVAGSQVDKLYGDRWIWLFSLVFTVIMIQFTEILPKTLGVNYNRTIASIAGRPLKAAVWFMTPILRLIQWVNRLLPIGRAAAAGAATIEEISALAGLARLARQINARQERIIKGASHLSGLTAGRIMIPVGQIAFLSITQTITEALIAAHTDAHTRFPVCEGDDTNRIAGYVNFKEMVYFMRTNPNEPSLRGVIRPVLFAGPEMPVPELLELLVSRHGHLAIIRDAAGAAVGMVTMEDIIEELFGDMEDEFDRLPQTVQALSGETWMAGGGAAMDAVARETGLALPAAAQTVSAWLAERLGRTPVPGDAHREAGAEFLVRRTRRAKVYEVSIARMKE